MHHPCRGKERRYRNGRITIGSDVWRVGEQLISGEAHPDGATFLARETDPRNVGVRSFDEVVWTMEHEAVHIALELDAPFHRAPGRPRRRRRARAPLARRWRAAVPSLPLVSRLHAASGSP